MLKFFSKKDKLLEHVFTLVKGTILAQIIGVAAQPVLRRLFSPEEFGVFALYVAMVSILAVVAMGRYELAIVLPEKDEEANALLNASVCLSFIFSLFLFLIVIFLNEYLYDLIVKLELIDSSLEGEVSLLKLSINLVPLGVFFVSTYNALGFWFTRKKEFANISKVRVSFSAVNAGATASFGSQGGTFIGIVWGYLIAQFSGIIFFLYLRKKEGKTYAKIQYRKLLKDYSDFPTKSLFSGFLNILANQLPIILIGSFFGVAIVAFYDIIIKILNIPVAMIGKSVSQVFYQKISHDVKQGVKIGKYVQQFAVKLFIFMLFPMTIVFFFGEYMFEFAFGKEYAISGRLASYFSLFFVVRFVYFSLSTLYTVKRKMGIELKQNVVYLLVQSLALIIGYYYYQDYKITFILLGLGGAICYLCFVFSLLKLAKQE